QAQVEWRLAAAVDGAAKLPAIKEKLSALRTEQERLGEELRAAAAAEGAARQQAERAGADLTGLRAALAEAGAGYPAVAARHAAIASAAQDSRMLAAALDELAAALEARERAGAIATLEAQAGGFESLELARSAVLRQAERSAMSDQV